MDTALVILNIKKEIAEKGEIILNKSGFLDGHIAEVVERMKDEKDYEIIFEGSNTIIKKKVNQDSFRNLLDNPITQSVNAIPSNSEAKQTWYTSPIFMYLIWPIITAIIAGFLIFIFGWN